MKTLKDLELQEKLKKRIMSQARFHWGTEYPPGSVLDVVIQKHAIGDSLVCDALLVIYPKGGTNFTEWKCLRKNSWEKYSEVAAMSRLLEDLQMPQGPDMYSNIDEGDRSGRG